MGGKIDLERALADKAPQGQDTPFPSVGANSQVLTEGTSFTEYLLRARPRISGLPPSSLRGECLSIYMPGNRGSAACPAQAP